MSEAGKNLAPKPECKIHLIPPGCPKIPPCAFKNGGGWLQEMKLLASKDLNGCASDRLSAIRGGLCRAWVRRTWRSGWGARH